MLVDSESRTYTELRRFTIAFLCGVVGIAIGFLSQAWHATWLELISGAIVIVSLGFCFAFFFRGFVASARALTHRPHFSNRTTSKGVDEDERGPNRDQGQ
jgi:hypothetical protein